MIHKYQNFLKLLISVVFINELKKKKSPFSEIGIYGKGTIILTCKSKIFAKTSQEKDKTIFISCIEIDWTRCAKVSFKAIPSTLAVNKRVMMVLYRSPVYHST